MYIIANTVAQHSKYIQSTKGKDKNNASKILKAAKKLLEDPDFDDKRRFCHKILGSHDGSLLAMMRSNWARRHLLSTCKLNLQIINIPQLYAYQYYEQS